MRTHVLKIDDAFWYNLNAGIKKCEIRFNDRDYRVGDRLVFPYKTVGVSQVATNSKAYFEITHIHTGLGLKDGFVVLSVIKKDGE